MRPDSRKHDILGAYKINKDKKNKPKKIEIRPRIGAHDVQVKANTVKRLLKKGNQVRVSVKFRGREVDHPDIGMGKLRALFELLGDEARMSVQPTLKGQELFLVVVPK